MKKRILFLGFLLMVFGLRIDAQTLKNIHRHNQPVLRIPTHLIDKVETAEVNGEQVLQVRQLNGYVSEIPLTQIDSITHSEGEAVDPAQLGNLRTASVMGVVSGPTGAPEMNAIVRSPYGGEETRTDPNGVFFLNNILVYDKLGYITITKPGFHQGSRSFLPLETGSNRVNVQLLPMTQSGTFSAGPGGTVTSGLLQLTFPANAVTLNGQPYTGSVRVYAAALDPTSPAMFDQMPGELLGGLNDSLRLLRSFGMASVELRDTNMNELQLANGVSATLTFNIPASLQAEATTTIDWWSFDEAQGLWMHEGVAQKQGNQYIGQANHFSWWNVDVPGTFNEFFGMVNSPASDPISNAKVLFASQSLGLIASYTNEQGEFIRRVPKNQSFVLDILLFCETNTDWDLALTDTIISQEDTIFGNYIVELNELYPISGTLVTCDDLPVESGYIKLGSQVFWVNELGQFTIFTCALGEQSISGYNTSVADSIVSTEFEIVNVVSQGVNLGNIQACNHFFGVVSDIDGNVYPTIQIGSQNWFAENLKTKSYSNGEAIDIQISNSSWEVLTSGAVSFYDNMEFYNSIYGGLYNWYATVDERGLCPAGWHIPSYQDFEDLLHELDSITGIPGNMGFYGLTAGGKLKSTHLWFDPNLGATNETSFCALPAGQRFGNGYYISLGTNLNLWTSNELDQDNAWKLNLFYNFTEAVLSWQAKQFGFSIRCLQD